MKKLLIFPALLCMLAAWLPSCSQMPRQEVFKKAEKPEYLPDTYEHFVYTVKGYPSTMEIYQNRELLKQANGKSNIYICLSQQRGRLYVNDQVAADWPVSTGVPGRETPQGNYRVLEKKKQYASNNYGNIYDANGRMVKYNADIMVDRVPEGGSFRGSPMPNWMRLTWDGVGMHTGKVQAGKRLSHGCIRTPNYMATRLFDITECGTKVFVAQAVEACYPATAAQAVQAAADEAKREKDIAAANAARKKQWEQDNPRAARRLAERQAQAKAQDSSATKKQASQTAKTNG